MQGLERLQQINWGRGGILSLWFQVGVIGAGGFWFLTVLGTVDTVFDHKNDGFKVPLFLNGFQISS